MSNLSDSQAGNAAKPSATSVIATLDIAATCYRILNTTMNSLFFISRSESGENSLSCDGQALRVRHAFACAHPSPTAEKPAENTLPAGNNAATQSCVQTHYMLASERHIMYTTVNIMDEKLFDDLTFVEWFV